MCYTFYNTYRYAYKNEAGIILILASSAKSATLITKFEGVLLTYLSVNLSNALK